MKLRVLFSGELVRKRILFLVEVDFQINTPSNDNLRVSLKYGNRKPSSCGIFGIPLFEPESLFLSGIGKYYLDTIQQVKKPFRVTNIHLYYSVIFPNKVAY